MASKRETIVENVDGLSAKELILKIESQCEKESIDLEDCTIEMLEGSIRIESNEKYWPDDGGILNT
mgnify:CR=1 FL=1